jgi:hypothetical protein
MGLCRFPSARQAAWNRDRARITERDMANAYTIGFANAAAQY